MLRKHRPFAETDNLPKVCQPEDHGDLQSPGTITSSEEDSGSFISGEDSEPDTDQEHDGLEPFSVPHI